jgi:NADH-quinone oxidoreductase subunit M
MLTVFFIIFPLISILLVALAGEKSKWVALLSTVVSFGATLYTLTEFQLTDSFQFAVKEEWIKSFGVHFYVGLDGISMMMVLLTNLLLPLIVLSSWNRTIERPVLFYSLVLLMQSALIGVFVSLDGFLYYIFWEVALIPIYFIILLWGGAKRIPVTFKFFIYTLSGSLLMLLGFIYLYFQMPAPSDFTFEKLSGVGRALSPEIQGVLFWAFFIAFAIKMPIFPFHTWQPDTYTEAPPQGSMLLSGIMLKMGIFSVLRWLIPMVPIGVQIWSKYAIVLCVIGIVYGAVIAISQKELKRLFAYSSFSHVGLIAAGLINPVLSMQGLEGGVIQMLAHGINVIGLFFVAQIIFDRWGTTELSDLGGIALKAPKLTVLFGIIMLGSVALPLTNGFVGEFLLLFGIFKFNSFIAILSTLGVILCGAYSLWLYNKIIFGNIKNNHLVQFVDLDIKEVFILFTAAVIVLLLGIYPTILFEYCHSISYLFVSNFISNVIL